MMLPERTIYFTGVAKAFEEMQQKDYRTAR